MDGEYIKNPPFLDTYTFSVQNILELHNKLQREDVFATCTNKHSSYLIPLSYLIFLTVSAVSEQCFSFLQLYALFTAAYWGNIHEERGRSICESLHFNVFTF